ncbi:MAG: hypothetical protein ABFD25_03050 [Clostridiaceae bacterium]
MGKKVAVLISGGFADRDGYDEFWNDLVRMWRVLLSSGYRDENIIVLYGDGSDYDDPARPFYSFRRHKLLARSLRSRLTTFPANRNSLEHVFNTLAGSGASIIGAPADPRLPGPFKIQKLLKNDSLFVWTFNHGKRIGGNCQLGLINGEGILDRDFAGLAGKIACDCKIFCMQQCFSGGFIDNLAGRRNLVLTACASDEIANRADTENETVDGETYHHGEFNHNLFTVLSSPKIRNIVDLPHISLNEFEKMRKVFNFVFKYICNHSSRPETAQYYDGFRAFADESITSASGKYNDVLKASWMLGNETGNVSADFVYEAKHVGASLSSQCVSAEIRVNGLLKEKFEFTAANQSLLLDIEADESHYGLFGCLSSDFVNKTIVFNGNVLAKLNIYCAAQPYSTDESATNITGYNGVVFQWI